MSGRATLNDVTSARRRQTDTAHFRLGDARRSAELAEVSRRLARAELTLERKRICELDVAHLEGKAAGHMFRANELAAL